MSLILATQNPGKLKEMQAMLAPLQCVSQAELNIPEVEETGVSFVENALIKARHASKYAHKPAIADDSGLVVDALDGEPGVYSARFAQRHNQILSNTDYLLKWMEGVEKDKRSAYFYCAIVFVRYANDPTPLIVTGRWNGQIALQASGEKGFGYDPVFYVPEYQCSAASLSFEQKNTLSHRGQAMRALKQALHENGYY